MDFKDGKFKRTSKKEMERQKKYGEYERNSLENPGALLRQKPYALVYAEKVREMNEQRAKSQEKEDETVGL